MFTIRTEDGLDGGPQSVRRALDLLLEFSIDRPHLTAAELATRVSLNRTTVYRLLAALEGSGLVRRDGATGSYSLGPRVLKLSEVYLHQLADLRTVAATPLTWLRDETGETAALHLREGLARVVLVQVESRHEVRRTYPDVGERLPLHAGAPSLAILAFLSNSEVDRYFAEAPARWPDFRGVGQRELRRALDEIRSRGFAISNQQRTVGVVSVAAPIFDRTGAVVAAVNVSGPVQRMGIQEAERYAPLVVQAASRISNDLGFESEAVATAGVTRNESNEE